MWVRGRCDFCGRSIERFTQAEAHAKGQCADSTNTADAVRPSTEQ
jgi:hypothetical protein